MRPDAPSDPEPRELVLPAGRARYTDEGEGRPFVFVHGMPGSVRDFRWIGAALAPSARVIRVDLPGFGGTEPAWGRDVDARGAFVSEVIETLGLERAVVVGHSMGGPVAVSAALRSPRVAALGLLASVGLTPHVALRVPGVRFSGWAMHVPGVASLSLPTLRRAFGRMGFRDVPDRELVHTLQVIARFRFDAHRHNLGALRKPTLVAWAADDRLVEEAISEKLYWRAPSGPRIRFADGGHNLQATRASELAEALTAWRY